MGKTNNNKRQAPSQKNTPLMTVFRGIILVAFLVVMTCTILYFVEMNGERSYFTLHFALPLIIFMVGIIAVFMAALSMQNMSGESRGDNFMIVVGILLMISAVVALVWSYF